MSVEPDYEPLWRWARTREKARIRKERGEPFPWVASDIITKYRFCNVRREDDRVTRWIEANIRRPFKDNDNLWLMLCIARQVNWPPSLKYIQEVPHAWPAKTFEPTCLAIALNQLAKKAEASKGEMKVWTGAYTINAPSTKGEKKTDHVALKVIGNLWRARDRFYAHFRQPGRERTLRSTHALLKEFDGWGDFMAYQAIVDMRFTRLLGSAPDREKWAAAGPGTKRGLNRLHGRDLKYPLSQIDALDEMREIYARYRDHLDFAIDFSDVPNMLCETDKYLRVWSGDGEPRALYVPGRGS